MERMALENKIRELRRILHENPEPSGREEGTKALLMRFIKRNTLLEVEDFDGGFYALQKTKKEEQPGIVFRAACCAVRTAEDRAEHRFGNDGHAAALCALGLLAGRETFGRDVYYLFETGSDSGRGGRACAQALKDLVRMGVENIITFDAHDPRIQNAIPLSGFENFLPTYQFIKGLFRVAPDFNVSPEHLMIVSPDEAGTARAVYMANVLGVDMGMFYKRRDYTRLENGKNPVIAQEFLGTPVEGKDIVLIDDIISSGDTALEIARELKSRRARRIFICATFGLFTDGLDKFDKAHEEGVFDSILTTNLVYQRPELLSKPYYHGCDLSKFVALIIDTLNHDGTLSDLLDPVDRINTFLAKKGFNLDSRNT